MFSWRIPRRGTPADVNLLCAWRSIIFSCVVIRLNASCTLTSSGWESSRYLGVCAVAVRPVIKANAMIFNCFMIMKCFIG